MTPWRIVLVGGSGQVGSMLARHFHGSGHSVTVVSRNPPPAEWKTAVWDGLTPGDWVEEIRAANLVVNLAGRSVNCRYNKRNRDEILTSRIHTTRLVGEAIRESSAPPEIWMNMSTATIYRHALDRPMDELTGELGGDEPDVPDTWRFSIDVARKWEQVFFDSPAPRTRKVALRAAMVMSPDPGGVFDTLLGLTKIGLGGRFDSGRQFMSWIHDIDFIRAIDFLLERKDIDGPINISSPNPIPQAEFMRELRQAYGIPFGLPSSRWMLEVGALLKQTETELLLKSRRVTPGRLLSSGFEFSYPIWMDAVSNLLNRASERK